jgi:hypothetical protein
MTPTKDEDPLTAEFKKRRNVGLYIDEAAATNHQEIQL